MIEREALEIAVESAIDEAIERALPRLVEGVASELGALLAPSPATAYAEPLVDSTAVARYLGVRPQWVRDNSSKLRARRLGRGTTRYSIGEIDELLMRAALNGNGAKPHV